MRNLMTLTAVAVLAMLPASTVARQKMTDAEKLEKALAGRVAGKPQSCVSLRDLHGTERLGDTIIYRTITRRVIYRMDTRGGCDSNSSDALITRTFGDRLCRGDIIRTADLFSGFESGSCTAAEFVPYSLPAKK